MKILFLGPCRKQDRKTGKLHKPFDPNTPSGAYIGLLQRALKGLGFECVCSNVIDGPCWGTNAKEENPQASILIADWPQFQRRLSRMRPDYIVGFGSNVKAAFAKIDKVDYCDGRIYSRGGAKLLFAPHPSFIMVYRRRNLGDYIGLLSSLIWQDVTSF